MAQGRLSVSERIEILSKKSEQSGLGEWSTEQMTISLTAARVNSSKSEHDSIVDVNSRSGECSEEDSTAHQSPEKMFSNKDFLSANMPDLFGDCHSNEVSAI
jgi:hypothetical protein